jgi:hypothetical protein
MDGVVRTRVGYSGGQKEHPTYRSIGDHSETLQIDFDPTRISYQKLLDIFWFKFIVNPAGGGIINPSLNYPLRAGGHHSNRTTVSLDPEALDRL